MAAAACGGLHVSANLDFDRAMTSFDDARGAVSVQRSALAESADALGQAQDLVQRIADADSELLLPGPERTARDAALTTGTDARRQAEKADALTVAASPEKPLWTWELFGAAGGLREDAERAARVEESLSTAERTVERAATALQEAGLAAITAAGGASVEFEAAHVNARNADIVALRSAATVIAAGDGVLDAQDADAYAALEAAAAAMLRSESDELAEKAGPLQSARQDVEAFARGLAPGLLLDFDWSEIVNGYGRNGGMGGVATWWFGDPGYATIELSDSVAEQWPSPRSEALVAHEVGHAISVHCRGMYDDSEAAIVEDWATAWAIGMGFTDDANGTWAYGPPPQELIDAARACR